MLRVAVLGKNQLWLGISVWMVVAFVWIFVRNSQPNVDKNYGRLDYSLGLLKYVGYLRSEETRRRWMARQATRVRFDDKTHHGL